MGRLKNKGSSSNNYAAYAPGAGAEDDRRDNYAVGPARERPAASSRQQWDSQYDDDVPEWGREYGSGSRSNTASRAPAGGSNGHGNPTAAAGGAKRESANVGGGRSEAQENWEHQF